MNDYILKIFTDFPITYFPFLPFEKKSSWKCAKQISVVPSDAACVSADENCDFKMRSKRKEEAVKEREELSSSQKFQPPGDSPALLGSRSRSFRPGARFCRSYLRATTETLCFLRVLAGCSHLICPRSTVACRMALSDWLTREYIQIGVVIVATFCFHFYFIRKRMDATISQSLNDLAKEQQQQQEPQFNDWAGSQ